MQQLNTPPLPVKQGQQLIATILDPEAWRAMPIFGQYWQACDALGIGPESWMKPFNTLPKAVAMIPQGNGDKPKVIYTGPYEEDEILVLAERIKQSRAFMSGEIDTEEGNGQRRTRRAK